MSALTVTLGADITALKRAMAGATELVGASARRMGKLTGAGLAGLEFKFTVPDDAAFFRLESN